MAEEGPAVPAASLVSLSHVLALLDAYWLHANIQGRHMESLSMSNSVRSFLRLLLAETLS